MDEHRADMREASRPFKLLRPLSPVWCYLLVPVAAGLLQWTLFVLAASRWPILGRPLPGDASWLLGATALAAGLGLLAVASVVGRVAGLGPERLAALAVLPAVAAVGVQVTGRWFILDDLRYIHPEEAVGVTVGLLGQVASPAVALLAAIPAPLLVLAWLHRRPWSLGVAALGTGAALATLVALGAQAWDLGRLSNALRAQDYAVASQVAPPGAVLPGVATVLALAAGALLFRRRAWGGGLAWALAWLPLAGLLPTTLADGFRLAAVARPEALPVVGAPLPTGVGTLVDLTGGDGRLDGHPVEDLPEALAAAGFTDMGPGFVGDGDPAVPWARRPRRSVVVALPGEARCGDVAPTMAVLLRFGVTGWLWASRLPDSARVGIPEVFRLPVIPLRLDDPMGQHQAPEARLSLGPGGAVALDRRGRCAGTWSLPEALEAMAADLAPCADGLAILPTPDLRLGDLHRVVDRLAGSHPAAPFSGRAAVIFTGHPGAAGAPPPG